MTPSEVHVIQITITDNAILRLPLQVSLDLTSIPMGKQVERQLIVFDFDW
jgi:hypothetical protein